MKNKSISTKEKIIETTINIIANEGLENTTAGNISKKGNFNKSIIFYYFENIDELLLMSLLKCIEEISPILNLNFDKYKDIEEYLNKNIINLLLDKNKIIYLKVILSFAHQNIFLENNLKDLRSILIDELLEVLRKSVVFYKKVDLTDDKVEDIASLIMTTFNGQGLLLLQDGSNDKFIRNWKLHTSLINNYIS